MEKPKRMPPLATNNLFPPLFWADDSTAHDGQCEYCGCLLPDEYHPNCKHCGGPRKAARVRFRNYFEARAHPNSCREYTWADYPDDAAVVKPRSTYRGHSITSSNGGFLVPDEFRALPLHVNCRCETVLGDVARQAADQEDAAWWGLEDFTPRKEGLMAQIARHLRRGE